MNRQGRQLVRCRQIVTIATIIMSTVVSGIQILLGKLYTRPPRTVHQSNRPYGRRTEICDLIQFRLTNETTSCSVMVDIIVPCIGSHYFDCEIFVKLFWFLHPVLNYLALYSMIFMRQYFTFRALRETRLKNFIPAEITIISVRF